MDIKYDVLIIGGGTAGCACAWNCARLGLKTLLLEKENYLGGTITGGLVIPVMKSGQNQINTDFYKFLIKKMREQNAQITYQNNPGWFNPEVLKQTLHNILYNEGVDIIYNSKIEDIETSMSHIKNITIPSNLLSVNITSIHTNNISIQNNKTLSVCIAANYFVDSTGNLFFSKKINCEILKNNYPSQPVSLRFIMRGVDLKKFGEWLLEADNDRNVTTVEHIGDHVHLSTAYTWDTDKHWALAPYFDDAVANKVLKDTDRNYFQIFTVAGMSDGLAFNCPRLLADYDLSDNKTLEFLYNEGKSAIKRLEKFCKVYFPGFENAYVYKIADKLGIRSSDRIKGKYVYSIENLRSGKKFDNPALVSDYPVDVHSRGKNTSTLEANGEYQVPIESLMSVDYDNLYVAGKCLSADELAQGALRVQASCFSMGEAVAKHISKISNDV